MPALATIAATLTDQPFFLSVRGGWLLDFAAADTGR